MSATELAATAAPAAAATPAPVAVPQEPGRLQVVVKPWGDVSVDGKPFGSTPLPQPISLVAGAHLVQIQHPGYEVWERSVVIRAGESQKLIVDLTTQGVRKP